MPRKDKHQQFIGMLSKAQASLGSALTILDNLPEDSRYDAGDVEGKLEVIEEELNDIIDYVE